MGAFRWAPPEELGRLRPGAAVQCLRRGDRSAQVEYEFEAAGTVDRSTWAATVCGKPSGGSAGRRDTIGEWCGAVAVGIHGRASQT